MFRFNNNKVESSLRSDYQEFLADEKISLARVIGLLGFAIYGAFAVVDYFALKSVFTEAMIIRAIGMGVLIISYLLTYTDKYLKYYRPIQIVMFLTCIAGVEAMIYLASPSDPAFNTYYAGLIIIMITVFSMTHISPLCSGLLAFSALLGYLYIETYVRDFIGNGTSVAVIINMFYFTSAIILGITAQSLRDNHLRKNFFLHRSLKDAYDKKSEEASDNEYLANHDALTDLPNRRYMMELLNKSLEIAHQKNKVLVVMFIDLNGFKQINDVYGHNAGDEVLLIVAKRLELAIRQGDHLSRLGGDEYLMGLMMDKENLGEIEGMANKFVDVISQSMNVEGLRVKVGASIGVAAYPIHGNNIESLISIADHRMYQAKKGNDKRSVEIGDIDFNEQESVVIFPGNKKNKI